MPEFASKASKVLFLVVIVNIAASNMSCIYIKHEKLGIKEDSACTFHIRCKERVKFQGQLKQLHKYRPLFSSY